MDKKLITALALSLGILLLFQAFTPKKQSVKTPLKRTSETTQSFVTREVETKKTSKDVTAAKETITTIETDKYTLSFSDIGAGIKKIALKGFIEDGKEHVLYSAKEGEKDLLVTSGGILAGTEKEKFTLKKKNSAIEYTFEEPGLVAIKKTYTFHNTFNQMTLDVEIKNLSAKNRSLFYSIEGPTKLDVTTSIAGRNFDETDVLIDGNVWKIKKLKEQQEKKGEITWVGTKNRYFALIAKPMEAPSAVVATPEGNKKISTSIISQEYQMFPGESIENRYLIYAGPLDQKNLEQTGYQMSKMIDYGIFGVVSKKLLLILRFFHKISRNWGVAIILLTLLINLILFPLTFKSFSSMQKMKQVQPHIQKLRDLHKDNPQKLNKETMELYKQHNVNPLGGCLPMLLQMPIFIALYQGLMRSVELKGAHFLWIKDLAKPDGVQIPFSLPLLGDHINILPLLMVGMMVVQQRITQAITPATGSGEQAKQQKTMMLMMPIFFGFLFYKMPSGLVLYWLTNTILMTGEQAFISKKTA
ncbi:MAG: membrane protein insertase YidC [Candidatus Aadella gelida]|nr:membrane protein insertase YidC [Candidatus Aadella gelida]